LGEVLQSVIPGPRHDRSSVRRRIGVGLRKAQEEEKEEEAGLRSEGRSEALSRGSTVIVAPMGGKSLEFQEQWKQFMKT
jgi:hypothetical protein